MVAYSCMPLFSLMPRAEVKFAGLHNVVPANATLNHMGKEVSSTPLEHIDSSLREESVKMRFQGPAGSGAAP